MKIVATILLVGLSPLVFSCPAKLLPHDPFESYDSIVVGEVVGVRLTEYIAQRTEAIEEGDRFVRYFSNVTADYELEVVVDRVISGPESRTLRVVAGGCGVATPQMGDFSVLFVNASRAIPIYSSEGGIYSDYLLKVGRWQLEQRRDR